MGNRMMVVGLCGVLGLLLLTGCAAFKKGPTDEELVMQQVQAFTADFLAANADNLLKYISDDFTNDRVASKKEIADHLAKAKEKGRIEEFKTFIADNHGAVDLKDAKVTIKDGVATVYPILASADMGSVTVELTLKKDPDKVWRAVGINVEGI